MAYELILSSDTLNIGRIKLNNFFNSATGLWSGSTGSQSIMAAASYNYTAGDYSLIAGNRSSGITGNYGSITGGKLNQIRGNFSHISSGYKNTCFNTINAYQLVVGGRENGVFNFCSTIINGRKISNSSKYGLIGNGLQNYIDTVLSYNTIINGYRNRVGSDIYNTKMSTILNGFKNSIYDASEYNTIINGRESQINAGKHSIVSGYKVNTTSSYNFAFGKSFTTYNLPFQVSFGNSARLVRINFTSAASNGIRLTNPGGAFQTSGADYGEYFEWEDKNISSDDRTGYFVELNNGLIKIANSTNVIGIVSKTTSYIGDSSDDYWNQMFLADEWGAPIERKFEKYSFIKEKEIEYVYFDEEGKSFSRLPELHEEMGDLIEGYKKEEGKYLEEFTVNKYNPNYNDSTEYVPRKKRKEWTVVGLLGKLRVRTSEQITGQFVDVNTSNGMAKNGTKYHVMSKNKDFDGNYGIVTIFFK